MLSSKRRGLHVCYGLFFKLVFVAVCGPPREEAMTGGLSKESNPLNYRWTEALTFGKVGRQLNFQSSVFVTMPDL